MDVLKEAAKAETVKEPVKKEAWDRAYINHDNFVFQPHEEVIRFVSRYLRKRTGTDAFEDVIENARGQRILDVGCGIGRHVKYCHEMGFDAYGFDFSAEAIRIGRLWLEREGIPCVETHLVEHDARMLSFGSGYFDHALSHGVLDSMPYTVAQQAVAEVHRVLRAGSYFYCDLIAGDASGLPSGFNGEIVVETQHEQGTIQSFFDRGKIDALFAGTFSLVDCVLVRRENKLTNTYSGRWHLVLQRD